MVPCICASLCIVLLAANPALVQAFFRRFQSVPFTKNPEKYLVWSAERLRSVIESEFFEACQ